MFPQVQGTPADTLAGASTTAHTINLPAGIQSGELLLFHFGLKLQVSDTPLTLDTLSETQVGFRRNALQQISALYAVTATGSEGTTTAVTLETAYQLSSRVYRISGSTGNVQSTSHMQTGTATPDPASLTPSWGAKDTLWMVFDVSNNGTHTISDWPDNYTSTGSLSHGTGATHTMGYGLRELNATSDDPNTFTYSTTGSHSGLTVAIEPAPEPEYSRVFAVRWG